MEPEAYRRVSFETWGAMAPGWERWRAQLEEAMTPVREWLLRELAPRRGDTVLELPAGAGDTGFAAAALVGEADLHEYERWITEVAFVMVVRGLSEDEREALGAELKEAFSPFVADGGYEFPGVALAAVAS